MEKTIKLGLTLLSDKSELVTVNDIITNAIGITNIHSDLNLKYASIVKNILSVLSGLLTGIMSANYKYNPITRDHLFIVSKSATGLNDYTISRILGEHGLSNVNYNLVVGKTYLILNFNWYLTPIKPDVIIHGAPEVVFSGVGFISSTFEKRKVVDCREVWTMDVPVIKQSIKDVTSLLCDNLRIMWGKREFNPIQAIAIAIDMFESLSTLMCLVAVNNNVAKFQATSVNPQLAMEALDSYLVNYKDNPQKITQVLMFLVGCLLDRIVAEGYSHLLVGYLNND